MKEPGGHQARKKNMSQNKTFLRPSAQTQRQAAAAHDALADGLSYANRRAIAQMRDEATLRRFMAKEYLSLSAAEEKLVAIKKSHQLRRRARVLGLAYWPALFEDGCDPQAFVAAERVLTRKTGGLWGAPAPDETDLAVTHHGGWDSMEYYGVSAGQVKMMWFAAGCRDNEKFRLQVGTGVCVKKGDSMPFARNFVRGFRWLAARKNKLPDAAGVPTYTVLAHKAIAALGRLSPEARAAATRGVGGTSTYLDGETSTRIVPVRVRDLNWAEVARYQHQHRAARTPAAKLRVQMAWASCPKALWTLAKANDITNILAFLTPFRKIGMASALRLARGETPVQLSEGVLSPREAHQWLMGEPGTPLSYLNSRLSRETGTKVEARSVRVIRWLESVRAGGRWEAMTRPRTAAGPGGAVRDFTALNILDEVADEDILTLRDGVTAVLERAARRLGEAWMTQHAADYRVLCPLPAWAATLPRFMRVLRTPAALIEEGRTQGHCVGGYAPMVERGQCHIIGIRTKHGRSTVELSADGREVRQHKGEDNGKPPARHVDFLAAWRRRAGLRTVRW